MIKGPEKLESKARSRIEKDWKENQGGQSGADTWVVGSGGRERSVGNE